MSSAQPPGSEPERSEISLPAIASLLVELDHLLGHLDDPSVASNTATRECLARCRRTLAALVPASLPAVPGPADCVDVTLEDEQYLPHGREMDVRLHYDWQDYDPADEPMPVWGAKITRIELLAVRYYDDRGEFVPWGEHHLGTARELAESQWELLETRCTEHGAQEESRRAHPLFRSSRTPGSGDWQEHPGAMAPSLRRRAGQASPRRQEGC